MRALCLHYPAAARAVGQMHQNRWGRDIPIAPIAEPGATSRRLYLPPGAWHDFRTNDIDRPVDLATLPLCVAPAPSFPQARLSGMSMSLSTNRSLCALIPEPTAASFSTKTMAPPSRMNAASSCA
jgi:hypothetical protein